MESFTILFKSTRALLEARSTQLRSWPRFYYIQCTGWTNKIVFAYIHLFACDAGKMVAKRTALTFYPAFFFHLAVATVKTGVHSKRWLFDYRFWMFKAKLSVVFGLFVCHSFAVISDSFTARIAPIFLIPFSFLFFLHAVVIICV